jgi:hypothetical protein
MSVQAYYTVRLARTAHMPITVAKKGADVLITAASA